MRDKSILLEMQRVYCTYEKDWMGFKISKRNFLTFHHITKRCMKGLENIDNGALLGKKSHELLNMIEIFDEDLYNRWNDLFMDINASKCKISDFNMQRIYNLKSETLNYNNPKIIKKTKKI